MAAIDRDRWQQLEPLLDHALELADDERTAWLGNLRLCAPELAAEVVALLAGEAAADRRGFLGDEFAADTPNVAFGGPELGSYLESALGDAYSIEREIDGG